jgi:hypothetical protein
MWLDWEAMAKKDLENRDTANDPVAISQALLHDLIDL